MEYALYVFTILSLVALGGISARTGGAPVMRAVLRVVIGGSLAMGLSGLAGYLFGASV
jgi:VIT1/CCC1 family predicted Fe2+/Mn2+ transporter